MIRSLVALWCVVALLSACSEKSEPPAKAPTVEPAADPAPAPEPKPEPAPEPALPPEADIQHGQVYWGVYLATAPVGSPRFDQAQARAKAMGFEIFHKDPGCDLPVGAAPPAPADTGANNMLISVYFEAEADARKVADALGKPTPWVGQVKTMCLD